MRRYFLASVVLATGAVMVLPAALVWLALRPHDPRSLVLSAPLAMLLSVAIARAGGRTPATRSSPT